jgi:hypothetical protein
VIPKVEFGPTEVPTYTRIPVTFRYLRGEAVEAQAFNLLDKAIDVGAANRMVNRSKGDDAEAFGGLITLIGNFMDDKDGTGSRWKPVELPPKKTDGPDAPKRFRGPDGKIHEWSRADTFLEVGNGSSRRRWLHLMNEDDDAAVDLETMQKLAEFAMEIAGKDRTRA